MNNQPRIEFSASSAHAPEPGPTASGRPATGWIRIGLIAALMLLTTTMPALSSDSAGRDLLSFADHLYAQGDYYRAITEYERVMFLHPGTPEAKTARFQIARSYFQSGKYTQAIERFRTLVMDLPSDPLGEQAQFMLAETYYRKGEYQSSIDGWETFLRSYPHSGRVDAAHIRLGWCHLRQGSAARAAEEFRKLPPDSPLAQQGNGLAEEALRAGDIPRKSPYLAGALAIVPGAGHLYIERPKEALGSFLLNGLFLWGAVRTNDHGNHVAAGILAFFELGWYSGNIFTAISGAHAYNRQADKHYFDRIDSQYRISISAAPSGGFITAFQMSF
ncbi:MAG: tetratricopeptide repeat protein [Nitrospirota bacterium]|nr:tetratricopeptide repeat protein [Nitrospirota bacterium]